MKNKEKIPSRCKLKLCDVYMFYRDMYVENKTRWNESKSIGIQYFFSVHIWRLLYNPFLLTS